MAGNQQDRTQNEHGGSFTLMVNIVAEDRCDTYSQQWEYGKYSLCTLAHVAHVAEYYQRNDCQYQQTVFHALLLGEVSGKRCGSHHKHDAVLNDGNRVGGPERIGVNSGE